MAVGNAHGTNPKIKPTLEGSERFDPFRVENMRL
jgi:hypothetical protein